MTIAWALALAPAACRAPGGGAGATASASAAASAEPVRAAAPATATTSIAPPSPGAQPDAASNTAPSGAARIPAGIYLMGSPISRGDLEERPAHEAIVAAFWLDVAEVTLDEYQACVNAGACTPTHTEHPFCNVRLEGRGDHPVNCVDALQADAYCAHLGKRLPREREWEWAARGGPDDRRFAWGDDPPDRTRACYMHEAGTCKVRSFAPGAFGLYDVSGNVWEWTSSWFAAYPDEPATGQFRVYRGGSWSRRFPKWLRNEIRNRYKPTEWSAALGIRCAKSILPLECPKDAAPNDRGDDCVRVSGTPLCEAGHAWNGKECAVGGVTLPAGTGAPAGARAESATTPSASATTEPAADAPIARSRTPQHDGDCVAHFPGRPHAYVYTGGKFHEREPIVKASGCAKRDVGRFGTSVCCAE